MINLFKFNNSLVIIIMSVTMSLC